AIAQQQRQWITELVRMLRNPGSGENEILVQVLSESPFGWPRNAQVRAFERKIERLEHERPVTEERLGSDGPPPGAAAE
ncbi:MAG: hypothetical protein AAF713_18355, partial [Pseudomonadota bacterium]